MDFKIKLYDNRSDGEEWVALVVSASGEKAVESFAESLESSLQNTLPDESGKYTKGWNWDCSIEKVEHNES